MKRIVLFVLLSVLVQVGYAQCFFANEPVGTRHIYEVKDGDSSDDLVYVLKERKVLPGGDTLLRLEMEGAFKDDKPLVFEERHSSKFITAMGVQQMLNALLGRMPDNLEVTEGPLVVSGEDPVYPRSLKVGSKLPNSTTNFTWGGEDKDDGFLVVLQARHQDRKATKKESLNVLSKKRQTLLVEETINLRVMVKGLKIEGDGKSQLNMEGEDLVLFSTDWKQKAWLLPGVGIVQREVTDADGNEISSSKLARVEK